MPLSWFQPIFIYSLIYDIGTYLVLSYFFFYLFKIKIININYLILSLVFLLTPFFHNDFLFDGISAFPDQSKYLSLSSQIRDNPLILFDREFTSDYRLKVLFSSSFFAFSPILSLETYKGISLFNRAIFIFTLIFLSQKKFLDNLNLIVFLLAPSLMLYSSIALRDNLVIILMFWFLYFFYEKKFFSTFLIIFLLSILRLPILAVIIIFLISNFVVKNEEIKLSNLIFLLIIITCLIYFFSELIAIKLNFYREGFFKEEFGAYRNISSNIEFQNYKINYNFSSIPLILSGFYNFMLPPFLKGKISLMYFFEFLESFFVFIYLLFRLKFKTNININILTKWFFVLIFSYLFFSMLVFNDGTMHRYKTSILFFVILGYFINERKKI